MGIDRFYHHKRTEQKTEEWRSLFQGGSEVEIGKTYTAIQQRCGKIAGPFTALGYENGILLVGSPESNRYCVIHTDVSENKGEIVTEKIRGGVFGINGNWSDMPSDENEAIAWIRNASRVKWFFALSEAEAQLFLEWFRKK